MYKVGGCFGFMSDFYFKPDPVSVEFSKVNRTWCEVAIPMLWKNPMQNTLSKKAESNLFDVIFSHLSEESRNILKNRGINNLIIETNQRPLFNYINFWKELNLSFYK
ncbi:hypothetical protein GLOIN_2v1870945 [Rhizophagus irregularis DAOM 181602=DAOM 197198]|nr:hypothetical protein GLOIN_2v1870945 [Rhizophagus irregularis DAOM 181602=DAOM 197198]